MYDVYINLEFVKTVDTEEEVWDIIGNSPFGSLYEVLYHDTGMAVEEFIPF